MCVAEKHRRADAWFSRLAPDANWNQCAVAHPTNHNKCAAAHSDKATMRRRVSEGLTVKRPMHRRKHNMATCNIRTCDCPRCDARMRIREGSQGATVTVRCTELGSCVQRTVGGCLHPVFCMPPPSHECHMYFCYRRRIVWSMLCFMNYPILLCGHYNLPDACNYWVSSIEVLSWKVATVLFFI